MMIDYFNKAKFLISEKEKFMKTLTEHTRNAKI